MPSVPAQVEVALRAVGCVNVKIEDDPVKVALDDEFQRLIHLFTHWDVSKKKEKRKQFKPEDVSREANAALKERRAAATASKREIDCADAVEAATAASHAIQSPTKCYNAAAVQKRSRAMSEVSGSNVGASISPARELRTKAARRGNSRREEMPLPSEVVAHCAEDHSPAADAQPVDASASDAMAQSPVNGLVDSVAAELQTPAEVGMDEEMAPAHEHDEEGMIAAGDDAEDAVEAVAHTPHKFPAISCVEAAEPSYISQDVLVASAGQELSDTIKFKRYSRTSGAEQSGIQAQCLSAAANARAQDEPSAHQECSIQENADMLPEPEAPCQPENEGEGECAEVSPVQALAEACAKAETSAVDVQADEIMTPVDEHIAAPALFTAEQADVAANSAANISEEIPTCAGPVQPSPFMDGASGESTEHGHARALEVHLSARVSAPALSEKLSEHFTEDNAPEASYGKHSTRVSAHVPSEKLSECCPEEHTAEDSDIKRSTPKSVSVRSENRSECCTEPVSKVNHSKQASVDAQNEKLSECYPDEHMCAEEEFSPSREPSMQAQIVCAIQDGQSRPERSIEAEDVETSPVFALVKSPVDSVAGRADFADENIAPAHERNGAPVLPDVVLVEPVAVDAEDHIVHAGSIPSAAPSSGVQQPSLSNSVAPEVSDRNVITFAPAVECDAEMPGGARQGTTPTLNMAVVTARPMEHDIAVCSLQEYAKDVQRHSEDTSAAEAPAHTGPQWWTPIFHDDGEGQEEVPAWSSDGGSADEIGAANGADDIPEDDMPLCDERAGVNVVDLHELAPHETPTPLPVGVWSQAAEEAADADLSSQQLQRLPTEHPELSLEPVCELAPTETPKLSSAVRLRPGDEAAEVELDVHQGPEDAERGMPSTPKFCEGEAEAASNAAPACEELPAPGPDAEPVQGPIVTPSVPFGQGGLLAKIRSKMLAQKASAAEKEPKRTKQPIAALAKAAKVKQEQQKVQDEREARKKALEQERTAQKQKAAASAAQMKKPVLKETRIPTTPTARKALQDLKKTQGGAVCQPPFIPGCKTPGGFPMPTPSTLHNNVNATPRAVNMAGTGIPGSAGPRRWRVPTPGPQYPITPEEELEDSDDDEVNEAREQKIAKFQAKWATSDRLKQAVQLQKFTDPESIFGTFAPTCDLVALMAPIKSEKEEFRYSVSRKSRHWGADAITQAEIASFARKKGYRLM